MPVTSLQGARGESAGCSVSTPPAIVPQGFAGSISASGLTQIWRRASSRSVGIQVDCDGFTRIGKGEAGDELGQGVFGADYHAG